MTVLLSEVFQKASTLPESLQDEVARELLNEIEWEQKWDKTLSSSARKIDRLAGQALRDYQDGKTTEIGFDSL
jgi:hypothetical protein